MTSSGETVPSWTTYLTSRDYDGFLRYMTDMTDYNIGLSCTRGYLEYYGSHGLTTVPVNHSFSIQNFPAGTILKDSNTGTELYVHEDTIITKHNSMVCTYHSSHLKQCLRHLIFRNEFKIFWNDLSDYILSQDQSSFCSSRTSSYTVTH
jgi:hypothetical protein